MGLQGTENSLRVSVATLALWSRRHPLETGRKTPPSSLRTTTPLCTIRRDFITIKAQNFADSPSPGRSGVAVGGHVLADQPPQREVQHPSAPGKSSGRLLEA